MTSLKLFWLLKWKLATPYVVSYFVSKRSAIPIRLRQRESVRQMPHLAHFPITQQDFHDVETNLHLRMLQELQVIERGLRKQPAFARVHRGGGARPVFGGTRLCQPPTARASRQVVGTATRRSYDLRRLRLHGLTTRVKKSHRYHLTKRGIQLAIFFTRSHARSLRPGLAQITGPEWEDGSALRRSFDQVLRHLDQLVADAKLAA